MSIDVIIKKKIDSLPNNIKKSIIEFDWPEVLLQIIKKHHLQIDDINNYRREVLLVLLGMSSQENFKENLRSHLHVDNETAMALVFDTNTNILEIIQKQSFTKDPHGVTKDVLKEHGVELIQEEIVSLPRNNTSPLQDLANNLLSKNPKEAIYIETIEPQKAIVQVKTNYNEPIEMSDLAGVTTHRTPYVNHEMDPTPENDLAKSLYTKTVTPGEHIFDASMSKEEQLLSDGKYLERLTPESK